MSGTAGKASKALKHDAMTADAAGGVVRGLVTAPFAGAVTLAVEPGVRVVAGSVLATIEAMKLEAAITAPCSGTVSRVAVGPQQQVEGGDVLVVIA